MSRQPQNTDPRTSYALLTFALLVAVAAVLLTTGLGAPGAG